MAMSASDKKDISSAKTIQDLPESCTLAQYMRALYCKVGARKLHYHLAKWYTEKSKNDHLPLTRFTGEESQKFSLHFMELLKIFEGGSKQVQFQVCVQAFIGLKLRQCVSLFSRFDVCEEQLFRLREVCQQYFNAYALFRKVNLTVWTVGYAIPYYTEKLFKLYGYGLGLAGMQGREAKHQQLHSYLDHSVGASLEQRWKIVFRHEFVELIWLRMHQPTTDTYKHREDYKSYEKYEDKAGYCPCGLSLPEDLMCCICGDRLMTLIEASCKTGSIVPELRTYLK